ncbi:hypothetical protein EMIT051CA3_30687 [Pseudomonas chlororaphis]
MEVGIGWPRVLLIFEIEHKCSFAKILAQKHADSQRTSIEKTHRKTGKGKFTNIVGRKAGEAGERDM